MIKLSFNRGLPVSEIALLEFGDFSNNGCLIDEGDLGIGVGVKNGFLDAIKIGRRDGETTGDGRILCPDLEGEKDLRATKNFPEAITFLKKVEVGLEGVCAFNWIRLDRVQRF